MVNEIINTNENSTLVDLSPGPSSLIQSLRDIGYSMETAVADIIDNSITANAKHINLRFSWNAGRPWLGIIDDGEGMDKYDLINAMRFGSMSPLELRTKEDLGRFGLGMKTASFSQCRHLTVLSKKDGVVACCEWDLDRIADSKENRWLLHVLNDDELLQREMLCSLLEEYLGNIGSGTIIYWEKIDRIDEQISEAQQECSLNGLIADTQQHLELVFHRFLSPEKGKSKVNMFLNGNRLVGFDPFNSKNITTVDLPEEHFVCEDERVVVQAFVLPHHSKISKEEYHKYAGKAGYLHNQGFYVYRNRRLIIKGTWFRLIKKAELTKLVRVMVDIPNNLDHLWKIDVKKSTASPPESIRHELRRIIGRIECSGKKVYQGRGQKLASSVQFPVWNRRAAGDEIFYEINRTHPLIKHLTASISPDQRELFNNILRVFEGSFPADLFFSDLAGSPEQLRRPCLKREHLTDLLDAYIEIWGIEDETSEEQISELLQVDPFSGNRKLILELLAEKGISL